MRVVILGGGRIGRHIARDMVRRGHDVTVIERQAARCQELVTEHDILVIEGDACDVEYLRQARTEAADVFVATTHEDDDNLVACQLAMAATGVPRAISRVNVPENVEIFDRLGIEAVSSTRLISELIEEGAAMATGGITRVSTLSAGDVEIIVVRVPPDEGAPPVRRLASIALPREAMVVAILRAGTTHVPDASTTIEPGDEVVVLTAPEVAERVAEGLVGHRT